MSDVHVSHVLVPGTMTRVERKCHSIATDTRESAFHLVTPSVHSGPVLVPGTVTGV
jgi:hypothetical protein